MNRGKLHETDRSRDIDVDSFHSAFHQVVLVPEPSAARVAQKRAPPLRVWFGARPCFKAIEIAPILAHTGVRRKKREKEEFVKQQSVWLRGHRVINLRSETKQRLKAGQYVYPHSQINDDQVRVLRKIDGLSDRLRSGIRIHNGASAESIKKG